ncbi:MAG: HNH endonuclease signature motif containing protein [bacterium]|nr:HNH endonuclease signature motif containing protein [bacterium]
MNDRFFSESIQYQAVLSNLEQNNGQLKCAFCGKNLTSKSECHFDHILAYAKGGKSTLENCQILCMDCNLSKSDKEMHDFLLEEKAKRFMSGENINSDISTTPQPTVIINEKMTKEKFDTIVGEFIKKKGDIKKVDFTRDKNGLPSVAYVTKYYGSMNGLKLAFGIKLDVVWTRENIWERLVEYSKINPEFKQADLVKANNLPSLPCILSYYPEYKNFSDVKIALGLDLNYELWSKEKVVVACKKYLKTHDKITQRDLRKENGLPTTKVIYNFFGTMQRFQEEIGSIVSKRQEFISKEEILAATEEIVSKSGAMFESRTAFLEMFPYSLSVIIHRFGSFDSFVEEANIKLLNTKKAKYTKQEVDNIVLAYLKDGNSIPTSAKQLSTLNLPSSSTILRFYDDWKEPFVVFSKMISFTSK